MGDDDTAPEELGEGKMLPLCDAAFWTTNTPILELLDSLYAFCLCLFLFKTGSHYGTLADLEPTR